MFLAIWNKKEGCWVVDYQHPSYYRLEIKELSFCDDLAKVSLTQCNKIWLTYKYDTNI